MFPKVSMETSVAVISFALRGTLSIYATAAWHLCRGRIFAVFAIDLVRSALFVSTSFYIQGWKKMELGFLKLVERPQEASMRSHPTQGLIFTTVR